MGRFTSPEWNEFLRTFDAWYEEACSHRNCPRLQPLSRKFLGWTENIVGFLDAHSRFDPRPILDYYRVVRGYYEPDDHSYPPVAKQELESTFIPVRELRERLWMYVENAGLLVADDSANGKPPSPAAADVTANTGAADGGEANGNAVDGPCGIDGFRWQGVTSRGLTRKVFALLTLLWKKHDRTASFSDLAEPVYGDPQETVTGDRVGSLRREANKFFHEHGILLTVTISRPRVAIIDRTDAQ
jgi:hypothetical protein